MRCRIFILVVPFLFCVISGGSAANSRPPRIPASTVFRDLEEAFLQACEGDNLGMVLRLLSNPRPIRSASKLSGLSIAVSKGFLALFDRFCSDKRVVKDDDIFVKLIQETNWWSGGPEMTERVLGWLRTKSDDKLWLTAFEMAASFGPLSIIQRLAEHRSDILGDDTVSFAFRLCRIACKYWNYETAKYLFTQFRLSEAGDRVLDLLALLLRLATEHGDLEFVRRICEIPNVNIMDALETAYQHNSVELLDLLMKHPASAKIPAEFHYSLFHKPCYLARRTPNPGSKEELMRYLIELQLEWPHDRIYEALQLSCRNGLFSTVLALLQYRPNMPLNVANGPRLPLRGAIRSGNLGLVQFLLAQPTISQVGETEILEAVSSRSGEMVSYLLGVAPHEIDLNGAFVKASGMGDEEVFELLVRRPGVDLARSGPAALSNACRHGRSSTVRRLLGLYPGLDPAAAENAAFIEAAGGGHLEILRLLSPLPHVDPTAQQNKALLLAAKKKHHAVVEYLLGFPEVSLAENRFGVIKMATGRGLELLLGDARADAFFRAESVDGLARLCRRSYERLLLFLSHPSCSHRLAHKVDHPDAKGLVYNFPPASFEAFETGDLAAVEEIDFAQTSWTLVDVLRRRYSRDGAIQAVLLDARIAQLGWGRGLCPDPYMRGFVRQRLHLSWLGLETALSKYCYVKALFHSSMPIAEVDYIYALAPFLQIAPDIVRYVEEEAAARHSARSAGRSAAEPRPAAGL